MLMTSGVLTLFTRKSSGNNLAEWMNAEGRTHSIIITETKHKEKLHRSIININAKHAFNDHQELTADIDSLGYSFDNQQAFTNRLKATTGYTGFYSF